MSNNIGSDYISVPHGQKITFVMPCGIFSIVIIASDQQCDSKYTKKIQNYLTSKTSREGVLDLRSTKA